MKKSGMSKGKGLEKTHVRLEMLKGKRRKKCTLYVYSYLPYRKNTSLKIRNVIVQKNSKFRRIVYSPRIRNLNLQLDVDK